MRFFIRWLFAGVPCAVLSGAPASAQDFPVKPVRMVTSAAGGGGDILTRILAQSVSGGLGQQVIVDNRGGILGFEVAAKAAPDGYTLLSTPNNFWQLPMMQQVSYDPIRDFAPIVFYVRAPNVVVVHPSLPVKSIKELVALAKAKPGQLNFGAGSTGSSSHLSAELFKYTAGINIVHVPYKGAAAALNDTLGGHIGLLFSNTAAVAPHEKSGRLRPLAVTTAQPTALAPNLPTVASAGYPGYEAAANYGLFAPAAAPAAAIARLNQEALRALARAEVRERFFAAGVDVVGGSPEQLMSAVKSDMARMGKVIKAAGIRAE